MKSAATLTFIVSLVGSPLQATAQENLDDWLLVRTVNPGTEIIVIARDLPPANGYFVAADGSGVTMLNVGDPALPAAASKVLRDIASTHPEYFPAAQRGGQFVFEKNVRMGPDGVFVANRKAVDLAQVVVRYGQRDIAEIKTARIDSNPVGCAIAGYYGGGLIGGLPGALIGGAIGRDTGPALLGMMAGWSFGSVHVYRKCRHKPEKVVYATR